MIEDLLEADLTPGKKNYSMPYKERAVKKRPNYSESLWGKLLQSECLADPSHRDSKTLFRIPYPVFKSLVQLVEDVEWFKVGKSDASGRPAAPLDLKILSCLRVLGRGCYFDAMEELCGISDEIL
jgi:hypothetical protein